MKEIIELVKCAEILNAAIDSFWNDNSDDSVSARKKMPEHHILSITRAQVKLGECLTFNNFLESQQGKEEKEAVVIDIIPIIKEKLDALFASRLVNGCHIKQYSIAKHFLPNVYEIHPIVPYFDESYDDEESDKEILKIGEHLNIHLKWVHYVYHK